MTKEQMKRLLPIITAFTEGEKIEWKDGGGQWKPFEDGIFADNAENFRVVPKLVLVPLTFDDREFLIGKIVTVKKSSISKEKIDIVGIITLVCKNGVSIGGSSDTLTSFKLLSEDFLFIDGTPCGKYTETKTA